MKEFRNDKELIDAIKKGGISLERAVLWILDQQKWRNAVVFQIRKLQMDLELKGDVFYEGLTALVMNVKRGDFKEKSTLRYYFEQICRNNLLSRLSKKSNESLKLVHSDTERIIRNEIVNQKTLQESDRQLEIQDLLQSLIDQLDDKCQKIIGHFLLGYSTQEIADIMDYKRQTIKNYARKCRVKLRDLGASNDYLIEQIKSLIG